MSVPVSGVQAFQVVLPVTKSVSPVRVNSIGVAV